VCVCVFVCLCEHARTRVPARLWQIGPHEIARETIASFVRTQAALAGMCSAWNVPISAVQRAWRAVAVRSRLDVNGAMQRMQAFALTSIPSYVTLHLHVGVCWNMPCCAAT
jgi:hypothetical protein